MKFVINITDLCNLDCSYCYRLTKNNAKTATIDKLKEIADFIAGMSREKEDKNISVTFFGGEPLLYPENIFTTIDYFLSNYQDYTYKFAINTNRTLFKDDILDKINKYDILLYLSIDGTKDAHDANRKRNNGEGSFEKIEPFLHKINRNVAYIEKVISCNNVGSTFSSIKYFYELGFDKFIASPNFTDDWDDKNFAVLKKEYKNLADFYYRLQSKKKEIYINLFDDKLNCHLFKWKLKEKSCSIGQTVFAFSVDGLIFPCTRFIANDRDNEFCIGDIKTGFDNAKIEMLNNFLNGDKAECSDCSIKERCLGNSCGCVSFSTTKSLLGISPFVCEHERALTRITDGIGEKLYSSKKK